jgi:hypothetical protein
VLAGSSTVALCVGDIFGVPLLSGQMLDSSGAGSDEEDEDDVQYARELAATLPRGMAATGACVQACVRAAGPRAHS